MPFLERVSDILLYLNRTAIGAGVLESVTGGVAGSVENVFDRGKRNGVIGRVDQISESV